MSAPCDSRKSLLTQIPLTCRSLTMRGCKGNRVGYDWLMRHLYSFLFYLSVPAILIRLWWKGRNFPAYKRRWAERFGWYDLKPFTESIWVHAVSFGETAAAEGLIRELLRMYPNDTLVITNLTPTGSERVQKTFGDRVKTVYLPYDLPSSVKRFLALTNPKLTIIMETELWPNILHQCHIRKIPILLANARLSARSAKGYRKILPLTSNYAQST